MNKKTVVVGVDVGHGNTKYVVNSDDKSVECNHIPSRAPLATCIDLAGETIHARNTMQVPVGNQVYEVGPDVNLSIATVSTQILHQSYTQSPEYLALAKGAVRATGKSKIDLLVTGLPVSQLSTKSKTLSSMLKGSHDLGNNISVDIKNVLVIAQPVGGLIDHAITNNFYDQMRRETNLVVDMGFYTLDWVVAVGIQPNAVRSGSFAGGIHQFLKNISQQISKDFSIDFNDISALDTGLRSGIFRLSGKEIELTKYILNARPALDESVNAMMNSTGPGTDIDNIILVGGGASILKPAIHHSFPTHNIHMAEASIYSNVRGYQRVGQEVMKGGQK